MGNIDFEKTDDTGFDTGGNGAGEPDILRLVLPASGLGFVLIVGIAVVMLLAKEITVRLILSLLFILLPYLALSASILLPAFSRKEHLMQNGLLITLSVLYLVVTIVLTLTMNLLRFSLRPFLAVELIVLAAGVIALLAGVSAKRHMDRH